MRGMFRHWRDGNRVAGPAAGGFALLVALAANADVSSTAWATPWPDTFVGRVEALALLETFNAELLTHDSATLTLERWCDVHRLASPARILARESPKEVRWASRCRRNNARSCVSAPQSASGTGGYGFDAVRSCCRKRTTGMCRRD